MGTKNAPGLYDCYVKADPDEPMFVLLARDWRAPYLVRIWSAMEGGDQLGAIMECVNMLRGQPIETFIEVGVDLGKVAAKIAEADTCAAHMEVWREGNR